MTSAVDAAAYSGEAIIRLILMVGAVMCVTWRPVDRCCVSHLAIPEPGSRFRRILREISWHTTRLTLCMCIR